MNVDLIEKLVDMVNRFASIPMAIYSIVLSCLLFKKAGEKPWKAIIPVYSSYKTYALFYDADMFWGLVSLFGIGFVLMSISNFFGSSVLYFLGVAVFVILIVAIIICDILCAVSKARCFNKSGWFAVGLVILPIVFRSILAFGKAEYTAPAVLKSNNSKTKNSKTNKNDKKRKKK